MIEERKKIFEAKAFLAIEQAIELRKKYWEENSYITLGTHLIELSMYETIEDFDTLKEKGIYWLSFCNKYLNKALIAKEKGKTYGALSANVVNKILEDEYHLLLSFYASIVRIMSNTFINFGEVNTSVDLCRIAMSELSKSPERNFIHIIVVGRCLSSSYIELGKMEEACQVQELLLELQSDDKYTPKYSSKNSVDEWTDPIFEKIKTIIDIVKIKFSLAQYKEADGYLRSALGIATEHSGKYSILACEIQYEILNFAKQNPDIEDEQFLDIYKLSLDIAKETSKRLKNEIDTSTALITKKSITQKMCYVKFLKFGIEIYRFSKEHRNFYLDLLSECCIAWPDEIIENLSFEYVDFAFYCFYEFIKYRKLSKACDVLQVMKPILQATYIDPSPTRARFFAMQVHLQNLIDFSDRSKSLPFYNPDLNDDKVSNYNSLACINDNRDATYRILVDFIHEGFDQMKRANNNQLESVMSPYFFYHLACTHLLNGNLTEAENTILRSFTFSIPGFTENEFEVHGSIDDINPISISSLCNLSILASSLFENSDQPKRAAKYYVFTIKLLSLDQKIESFNEEHNELFSSFYVNQNRRERLKNLQQCLIKLIKLHQSLFEKNPAFYSMNQLSNYKKHLISVEEQYKKISEIHNKFIDSINGIIFHSGPDVSEIISDALASLEENEKLTISNHPVEQKYLDPGQPDYLRKE